MTSWSVTETWIWSSLIIFRFLIFLGVKQWLILLHHWSHVIWITWYDSYRVTCVDILQTDFIQNNSVWSFSGHRKYLFYSPFGGNKSRDMSESCDSGQMMSHVMQVMSHDRPVVKCGGHLIMAKNIQLEKLGVVLIIDWAYGLWNLSRDITSTKLKSYQSWPDADTEKTDSDARLCHCEGYAIMH